MSDSEIVHGLLHESHDLTLVGLDLLLEDLSLVCFSSKLFVSLCAQWFLSRVLKVLLSSLAQGSRVVLL
mgnify:CR=1 FL=1